MGNPSYGEELGAMDMRNVAEPVAMLAIGDGVIGIATPRRHSLL